ncbi:MAG: hypothetical protein ACP5N1_05785 [Candidatus Woesearchaeota archaeon]
MTIDSTLINIKGNILDNIKKIDRTTIRNAYDIQKDRTSNHDLYDLSFWTSDTPIYAYENNDAIIYLPDKKNNLLIQDTNIIPYLMNNGNYFPTNTEILKILEDTKTTKIPISELELIYTSNPRFSYFEILIKEILENKIVLNPAQKMFTEKIYGSEIEFKSIITSMYKKGIKKTKIKVLTPIQILEVLWKNNVNYFARGSSLDSFKQTSDFDATCTYLSNIDKYIRGTPLEK